VKSRKLVGRLIAALGALAVTAVAVGTTAVVGSPSASADSGSSGTVSGIVYRDWNYTGSTTERFGTTFTTPTNFNENRNWSPSYWNGQPMTLVDPPMRQAYLRSQEPGEPGISIIVTDSDGKQWSGVTGSAGTFSIAVSDAKTTAVRVEMAIPSSKSHLVVGPKGAKSGGNVQFTTLGAAATTKMYFSVANPAQYCKHDSSAVLRLVTPCFKFGDQKSATPTSVLDSVPFDAPTSAYAAAPAKISEATANQIGATYGLAWDANRQNLFASAYMRRHVGFGPFGTGAIYKISGPGSGAKSVSPWADLNALFGADTAGADPHPTGAAGCSGVQVFNPAVHAGSITECENAWGHDVASYDKVGKISLGDMDVSEDGANLFVVNMNDRKIYKMSTITAPATSADVATMVIPAAASGTSYKCAANDSRPMAVTIHDGVGYVGVVCSQEAGAAASDPRGYIYKFNPTTMVATAAPVANFIWDFAKTGYQRNSAWSSAWQLPTSVPAGAWPQERTVQVLISSIVFDDQDMLIGLRNRYRDQIGQWTFNLDLTNTTTRTDPSDQGAGIVRACPTATGWAAEGDVASGWSEANCTGGYFNGWSSGAATAYGTTSLFDPWGQYSAMGSMVLLQGSQSRRNDLYSASHTDLNGGKLVATWNEPLGTWYSAGVGAITPNDGWSLGGGATSATGYTGADGSSQDVYVGSGYSDSVKPSPTMGKSNGLGDLEVLCLYAPIDIGDRLWKDLNNNGLQDAGEPGLGSVTVNLMQGVSVAPIASVTTDVNGNYLFTSRTGTTVAGGSTVFNVATLKPGSINMWVKVDLTDIDITPGLTPTTKGAGTNRRIDSDGLADGGSAEFNIVDTYAQSLDIDFGFCDGTCGGATLPGGGGTGGGGTPPPAGDIYAIGDKVFIDINGNGTFDTGEQGLANVGVTLLDNATGATVGTPVTTGTAGNYVFDNLATGTYRVKFTLPAGSTGATFTTRAVGADRAVDSDPYAATGITAPFTLDGTIAGLRPAVPGTDFTTRATKILPTVDAGVIMPAAVVGSTICLTPT
jgi:SdrD B-like domain